MTLEQLAERLRTERFNEAYYQLGSDVPGRSDVYCLIPTSQGPQRCFEIIYSERGASQHVGWYASEADAAQAFYDLLKRNEAWSRAHLLASNSSVGPITLLGQRLAAAGIAFQRNDILVGAPGEKSYRIFVHGDDLDRALAVAQTP